MIVEAIKEILAEVQMAKTAQEDQSPEFSHKRTPEPEVSSEASLQKISSEEADYLKSKLSMLGLGKYAAYIDEINDVAGELVKSLLEEMEKLASSSDVANPFSVSDRIDLSNSAVDPITKFALS